MQSPSGLGAHAFEPSPDVARWDKGGRALRTCRICGRGGRGSGHRRNGLTGEARAPRPARPAPARAEREAPPLPQRGLAPSRAAERIAATERHRERAERPPLAALPQPRARPGQKKMAAELVALAITLDAILELPADAVGWRLRMRCADLRGILGVERFPTLRLDPTAQPEPLAEPPSLVERRPELQPQPREATPHAYSVAVIAGMPDKALRTLARRAVDAGWEADRTAAGHIALTLGSQRIDLATRNGHGRAWQNAKAMAKRHGIDVTGL